jgi:hypothetical protein
MKKLISTAFFALPMISFGQTYVQDSEDGNTYKTEVTYYNGSVSYVISDSRIVDESEANSIGGWKLYTGPAERTIFNLPSEVTVIKNCLHTNNWPCALISTK